MYLGGNRRWVFLSINTNTGRTLAQRMCHRYDTKRHVSHQASKMT